MQRMRFKTSNIKEAKHTELVSCVGWASPDDVISIGDDHQILRWNLVSAETVKVRPTQLFPMTNSCSELLMIDSWSGLRAPGRVFPH